MKKSIVQKLYEISIRVMSIVLAIKNQDLSEYENEEETEDFKELIGLLEDQIEGVLEVSQEMKSEIIFYSEKKDLNLYRVKHDLLEGDDAGLLKKLFKLESDIEKTLNESKADIPNDISSIYDLEADLSFLDRLYCSIIFNNYEILDEVSEE